MDSRQTSQLASAAVEYKSTSRTVTASIDQTGEQSLRLTDRLPLSVKELMAGGLAGAIAKTSVAPFERVKILYQTRQGNIQSLGVWRAMGEIMRTEGFLSFYRGNGASVLRILPYAGIQFMAYEQYRRWIIEGYPASAKSPAVELYSGALAGGTAVLLTYPLDLARTQLAYQVPGQRSGSVNLRTSSVLSSAHKGIGDVLTKVYKDNGVRGLYRGVGATLYGILPYAGLKFYVYDLLKYNISKNGERLSVPDKLACGAVAGLVGQTLTYPLDVVRRQMQVQDVRRTVISANVADSPLLTSGAPFKGTFEGLVKIVNAQGWRQLFAGLSLNYLKLVPSVAIGFTAYDSMKDYLRVPPRLWHMLVPTAHGAVKS